MTIRPADCSPEVDAFLNTNVYDLILTRETDNKLRWDADFNGTPFELYIPKWRVPQPWPHRIRVALFDLREASDGRGKLRREHFEPNLSLRLNPILTTIERSEEMKHTIRFRPIGEKDEWEIGEPYVPNELVPGDTDRLRILVLWDIESRGEFAPTQ